MSQELLKRQFIREKQDLLEGFIEWLNEHSWVTGADHAKRKWLVEEFMKDQDEARG
jgi:hypothetical protein